MLEAVWTGGLQGRVRLIGGASLLSRPVPRRSLVRIRRLRGGSLGGHDLSRLRALRAHVNYVEKSRSQHVLLYNRVLKMMW